MKGIVANYYITTTKLKLLIMNIKTKSTLQKMEKIMRVRNYSERTIQIYSSYVGKFLKSFGRDPYHIPVSLAKIYLQDYEYSSISQQNQVINSVKLFYREVVGLKLKSLNIRRPRTEKRLPRVIDGDTIKQRLLEIPNLKHKAFLTLTYSVGLRRSEVINLKIKDVDSKRMLISIKNAKGKKDRMVPLSNYVLNLLRDYYRIYKPKIYLFNGQNSLRYSVSSCQNIYKRYIDMNSSMHTLRHSCFTNLLENGTDLRVIQKIAGHSSSKTTEIYTHVSNNVLQRVRLPI